MNFFQMMMRNSYLADVTDSIDDYLFDPTISVTEMIDQYEIPIHNQEAKKEKRNLRCVVCNAKAFGYNFDRITCESCKAFFRRNALRNRNELHCRFSGNCNVTVETRRHCSYCRIEKCFAVGMRKEWIRSEEEKQEKRLHLQITRRRKRHNYLLETPSMISNNLIQISSNDRQRLNNLTHCYEQYTGEPCILNYSPPSQTVVLRLDEFYNRKKSVIVHLISYFKHLPELKLLDIDDQVTLIKRNLRFLLPINYALLKTPVHSKIGSTTIETTGCVNNINLHEMYRTLSNIFVQFVNCDPLMIKLFLLILFFSTNTLTHASIDDFDQYKQKDTIQTIQSSYTELLWSYMLDKWGEKQTVVVYMKLISKYLYVQMIMDQMDTVIRLNPNLPHLDSLLKIVLQLT